MKFAGGWGPCASLSVLSLTSPRPPLLPWARSAASSTFQIWAKLWPHPPQPGSCLGSCHCIWFRGVLFVPSCCLFPCGLPLRSHTKSFVDFAENGGRSSPGLSVREDLWALHSSDPLAPSCGRGGAGMALGLQLPRMPCAAQVMASSVCTAPWEEGAPIPRPRGPERGERCVSAPATGPPCLPPCQHLARSP